MTELPVEIVRCVACGATKTGFNGAWSKRCKGAGPSYNPQHGPTESALYVPAGALAAERERWERELLSAKVIDAVEGEIIAADENGSGSYRLDAEAALRAALDAMKEGRDGD